MGQRATTSSRNAPDAALAAARLTPTRASRRSLVLAFINRYLEETGLSPSYGEIGAALGIDRSHARDIVRRLVRDGLLVRERGARRGIALPTERDRALRALRRLGYVIDEDVLALRLPEQHGLGAPTKCTLPAVPELDHKGPIGVDGFDLPKGVHVDGESEAGSRRGRRRRRAGQGGNAARTA